jgi:hypothetical protein
MNCPGFEQLIDYCEALLSDHEAQPIAAHLASGCQQCAADCRWYERVRALAAGDVSVEPPPWVLKRALKLFDRKAARPDLFDRLGRRVASLLFDSLSQSTLPGVRLAESPNRQLLYRAGPYSIDLQIALSEPSNVDLTGQVLRENDSRFESVAGLSLALIRDSETVRSTVTNEVGEFTIEGIERGEYELTIATREAVITIRQMPITPS